jgi:transcription antitermination factor NusG
MMDFKWFAIFVVQGKEFFVKDKISHIVSSGLNEVLVPTTKEISEIRRKKIVKNVPLYPSYIFLHAKLDKVLISNILEIAFVLKILGNSRPLYISEQEMELVKVMSGDNKIRSAFKYKVGDIIEILGGHCKGLSGRVVEIIDVNTIKAEIQIFNRAIYTSIKIDDLKAA